MYLQLQVKALEAADAARRKEAQRAAERAQQRQQLEAQKAERLKRAHDAKVSPESHQSILQCSNKTQRAQVHLGRKGSIIITMSSSLAPC